MLMNRRFGVSQTWYPRLRTALPDARDIVDELAHRQAGTPQPRRSVHDPTDPVGRPLFNVLAMVAEFEADLIRMRTREGMKIARAKGNLCGGKPKPSPAQEAHLVALHRAGGHTVAELFSIGRATVYRAVARASAKDATTLTLPCVDGAV